MENAVEAFKMAFAVLVFVVALSIAIFAFTEAKATTDILIQNSDKYGEYEYANQESVYYIGDSTKTTRLVSIESVVPTIYRAYKENYKIVFLGDLFYDGGESNCLYKKMDEDSDGNPIEIPMFSIDLQDVSISMGNQEEFLNGIMFHKFYKTVDGVEKLANFDSLDSSFMKKADGKYINEKKYFMDTYQLTEIGSESLYSKLKRARTIKENLGTFYQEDEDPEILPGGVPTNSDDYVPEANKTKKRVITYTVNSY